MNRVVLQIIMVFLTFLSLCSCNSTKQRLSINEITMKNNQPQLAFVVSAKTKLFLSELKRELEEKNSSITTFEPSSKLVQCYDIRKQSTIYFISGLIKTNHHFDQNEIESIQVVLGSSTGNSRSVQIPLSVLYQFLEISGIDYFEISEKSNTL